MTTDRIPETGVVHHPAGTAPSTWAMGSLFEQLLTADRSGGSLGVALVTQPPGVATPLHRHTREAEVFYLLEGGMTYRAGEEYFQLAEGSFIYLPQGLPHAFRVIGDRPARMLAVVAPGHLLGLYDEVGIPAAARRVPGEDGQPAEVEIPRWSEAAPRYGLEVLGPPIPA